MIPGTRPPRARPDRARILIATVAVLLVAVLLVAAPTVAADPLTDGDEAVTVATVQFRVRPQIYSSIERFRSEVTAIVREAIRLHDADLIVFPEYVNVFLIAAEYPDAVREADSIAEAMRLIGGSGGAPALATVVRRHAAQIARITQNMWRSIADSHNVAIVPGTFLVPVVENETTVLRNRLIVVDEHGAIVYRQDKAYLTEEESRLLGLSAASYRDASPFHLDGLSIGITICRDSYFDTWHEPLAGVDLWIDLRANGEPYSQEVYERFLTTLPERVVDAGAAAGVNASLTGEFLNHVWAGPSYVVDEDGERVASSASPVGTEITAIRLVHDEAGWRLE
jgi:predicted amidohydrolase